LDIRATLAQCLEIMVGNAGLLAGNFEGRSDRSLSTHIVLAVHHNIV
jgi:hypothetical protein